MFGVFFSSAQFLMVHSTQSLWVQIDRLLIFARQIWCVHGSPFHILFCIAYVSVHYGVLVVCVSRDYAFSDRYCVLIFITCDRSVGERNVASEPAQTNAFDVQRCVKQP